MATRYCEKCNKTMDEKEFYTSKRLDRYPDGRFNKCKHCLTMHVDNWDPETYKWILEEADVPYIKKEWDALLAKFAQDGKKITGVTILGRYFSKMKLKQFSKYHWDDTEQLAEEARQLQVQSMRAQGYTSDEIDEELRTDRTPARPKDMQVNDSEADTPQFYDPEQEEDEFSSQLTDEDKRYLRLKWGRGYRAEEWVRLESLYNDFMNSYDIQAAGHKDTLIMICKASLKANQLLDAGDIDGAQKMSKVYDSLMKSGNFQGIQNKNAQGEGIDSIGEIVRICEQQGFIPRFYTVEPRDKVDQTLLDIQHYNHTLVTEELNLGNMIESSLIAISKDKEREQKIMLEGEDEDEEALQDKALFTYREDMEIEDDEIIEQLEDDLEARAEDKKMLAGGDQDGT